jgi:hypothetical protein
MSPDPDQLDPGKLAAALRAAYTHRADIPPSVESAILSTSRQSFDARRRRRMTIRWATGLAASLAAALTLAVMLHHPPTPPKQLAKSSLKGDLNADGRIDMTDALLLAKHVAAHDKSDTAWDTNGDGIIDQKDIDALAAIAVSLNHSTASFLPRPVLREKRAELATARERVGVRAFSANQTTTPSLPAFDHLGLNRLPVGLASASEIVDRPNRISLANASPTKNPHAEAPQ